MLSYPTDRADWRLLGGDILGNRTILEQQSQELYDTGAA